MYLRRDQAPNEGSLREPEYAAMFPNAVVVVRQENLISHDTLSERVFSDHRSVMGILASSSPDTFDRKWEHKLHYGGAVDSFIEDNRARNSSS